MTMFCNTQAHLSNIMSNEPDAEADSGDEVHNDGDEGHDDEGPEQLGLLLPGAIDHHDHGDDLEDVDDQPDDPPEAVAGGEPVLEDVQDHEDEGGDADDERARFEAAAAAAGAEVLHFGLAVEEGSRLVSVLE